MRKSYEPDSGLDACQEDLKSANHPEILSIKFSETSDLENYSGYPNKFDLANRDSLENMGKISRGIHKLTNHNNTCSNHHGATGKNFDVVGTTDTRCTAETSKNSKKDLSLSSNDSVFSKNETFIEKRTEIGLQDILEET